MTVKLFVLGRPGSGKSSCTHYIIRLAERRGWVSIQINDYQILQEMLHKDTDHKRFRPTACNGFDVLDFSVLDIVLEKLEKIDEAEVKKNTPKDELNVIVIESSAMAKSDQSPVSRETSPSPSKTFRSWIPTNEKNAFFTLITMIYLVFAAIHFCITGDGSMLTYLLAAVAGYAGVKGIESKINQKNDKSDH